MKNNNEEIYFDTETLASLLDVSVSWLKKSRKKEGSIPFIYVGCNRVLYKQSDILTWIGRKDLPIKFYGSKKLAKLLGYSEHWVEKNRKQKNAIPFRRFGSLIRYNELEIKQWVKKHSRYGKGAYKVILEQD